MAPKGKAPAGKDVVVAALADLASPDKAGSSFAALAELSETDDGLSAILRSSP